MAPTTPPRVSGRPPTSPPATEEQARAAGYTRAFVADEPRLSEMVETYAELGFEVIVVPVSLDAADCTECMRQRPEAFRVIYTRRPGGGGHP